MRSANSGITGAHDQVDPLFDDFGSVASELCPTIVARKARLGDWEGDTVVSAGHKGGLLTLVERKTQLAKIIKLPRATAHATQKAAVRRLKPIGDFVHTITFDNGKEFAAHQDIASVNAAPTLATPK